MPSLSLRTDEPLLNIPNFPLEVALGTLYRPGPALGVNQAGHLAAADLVARGASQDGAGTLEVGRLTCLARLCKFVCFLLLPALIIWHWLHTGFVRMVVFVDLLFVCRNSVVCHSIAWLGGKPHST